MLPALVQSSKQEHKSQAGNRRTFLPTKFELVQASMTDLQSLQTGPLLPEIPLSDLSTLHTELLTSVQESNVHFGIRISLPVTLRLI